MWGRACDVHRVPRGWGFQQRRRPRLQKNAGAAATVFSFIGIPASRPCFCPPPCWVSLLFIRVFSERSREAASARPAAGLDSGHIGRGWSLSWGSAETREREVTAALARRRQCQTGSGQCLVLQTGTCCVQMPEATVTPAVSSHEAGGLRRAAFFIRPLPPSQAAGALPDMLKHSISRSPC